MMSGVAVFTGQFLDWFQVPRQAHLFVLMCLAVLVALAIGYLVGLERRRGEVGGRSARTAAPPGREDRIDRIHQEIQDLRDQNKHYRYLLVSIPRVIKHLNTTVDQEELASSIVGLAKEVARTDTAHLYISQEEGGYLEKVFAVGQGSEAVDGFNPGEGIVGRAAAEREIIDREQAADPPESGTGYPQGEPAPEDESGLSIAAPVQFEGSFIGVLGVGNITNPTGDEKDLMRMVAEMAGVSLYNRAFLGDAKRKAATDPLTGLYNRRQFFAMAREEVRKTIVSGGMISIFLFDIDNFKNYNDVNGHGEGDNLLKDLSSLVQKESRKTAVVARYGGEEFIVMLTGISKGDACSYARRLCEKIAAHPFAHREKQPLGILSISGGVAAYPTDGTSIKEVIRLADVALYAAKEQGKNRVEVHGNLLFAEEGEGDAIPPDLAGLGGDGEDSAPGPG
jgi:diguanylate cyclase (GGDEF)-like protein